MNFNFIVRAQSLLLEAAVATEDSPITSHQKKKNSSVDIFNFPLYNFSTHNIV